jgi:hypothetical protein
MTDQPKRNNRVLAVIVVLVTIVGITMNEDAHRSFAAPAKVTPEQAKAEAAKQKLHDMFKAGAETAGRHMRGLQADMRDPDSFALVAARGNLDGSRLCVVYRARNGFGGLNVESAAYAGNRWHIPASRARCKGLLFNFKDSGLYGVVLD